MTDRIIDMTDRIIELTTGIKAWGYVVTAEPMPDHEYQFTCWLKRVLQKLETEAASMRKDYGFRGRSKNLLSSLHAAMPYPDWGIELAA
jgi:hypothetical protein